MLWFQNIPELYMNIRGSWIFQGHTRFRIEFFMIDVWQYYGYSLDSDYARVLNMLGFHLVLNEILHNGYSPEYVSVT